METNMRKRQGKPWWLLRIDQIMADGEWRSERQILEAAQKGVIGGRPVDEVDVTAWLDWRVGDGILQFKEIKSRDYNRVWTYWRVMLGVEPLVRRSIWETRDDRMQDVLSSKIP
jgi:hypothetical protein